MIRPNSRALAAVLAASTFVLACGISAASVGPTSVLYLVNYGEFNNGASTGLDLIQGVNESSYVTGNLVDTCIGVAGGDVRTMGYGFGDVGSRFDLFGGPLSGGPYTNGIANSQLHDGTSDGSYNYSVDYVTGDVVQFDRNWANQTTLFNVTNSLPSAGWITMNAADGSYWISQWGGPSLVNHYSHTGTLLGGFDSFVGGNQGLALDPVDGTLWMSYQDTLYQFDQAGNQLQNLSYSMAAQWYGMEFETSPVPEPATLSVLGLGALALLRRRNRS